MKVRVHAKDCKLQNPLWDYLMEKESWERANCTCEAFTNTVKLNLEEKWDSLGAPVKSPGEDHAEIPAEKADIPTQDDEESLPDVKNDFVGWLALKITIFLFWCCKHDIHHDWTWSLMAPSKDICARCKKRRDRSKK